MPALSVLGVVPFFANRCGNWQYGVTIRAFFNGKRFFFLSIVKTPFALVKVKTVAHGIANHVDDGGVSLAWRWP